MFRHLCSRVWVVSIIRREYFLIGKVLIVFYDLLLLLVRLRSLLSTERARLRLVGPRHRTAGHPRHDASKHGRRYSRRCTVARLAVPRLCTNLKKNLA